MSHQCFLDDDRLCTQSCMAYVASSEGPGCTLLQLAKDMSKALQPETRVVDNSIHHPASPPAPEIKR